MSFTSCNSILFTLSYSSEFITAFSRSLENPIRLYIDSSILMITLSDNAIVIRYEKLCDFRILKYPVEQCPHSSHSPV